MKELQFFTNDKTFTYIDVSSPTFEEEKRQLLIQDFVVSGDRMKEYAVFSLVAGLFGGI